jgi:glycosyltransferase involved in cell wall biosynthesis
MSDNSVRDAGVPMRVLLDAHHIGQRQTGNETYVRRLISELRGYEDLRVVAGVTASGWAEEDVSPPVIRRRVPRHGLLRLLALSGLAHMERVDVVHAIYFLPWLTRRPSVLTIHDIAFEIHPEFFSRTAVMRNRLLVRESARRAGRVVTVSETSRRDLIERYGLPPERVVAIPNGVSSEFASLDANRPPSADGAIRILAVGTVQPRKNLPRLVRAVDSLSRRRPIRLRIIGPDGYQGAAIREMASARGVVEVVGYVPQDALLDEYRQADIFVYPSIYEGFGLPVIEAMAAGLPVVTTTGGSLPEVAGDAALLVDPLDESALADAIERLIDDEGLRRELIARGRVRAASFSWSRAAAQLVATYRSVL